MMQSTAYVFYSGTFYYKKIPVISSVALLLSLAIVQVLHSCAMNVSFAELVNFCVLINSIWSQCYTVKCTSLSR